MKNLVDQLNEALNANITESSSWCCPLRKNFDKLYDMLSKSNATTYLEQLGMDEDSFGDLKEAVSIIKSFIGYVDLCFEGDGDEPDFPGHINNKRDFYKWIEGSAAHDWLETDEDVADSYDSDIVEAIIGEFPKIYKAVLGVDWGK